MVSQSSVVDAIVRQRLLKAGAIEVIFGDFIGAVKFPKSLIQWMIHLMKLMCAGNATAFQIVLVVNSLKSHLCGGVKVPKGSVKVEKDVLVF